MKTQETETKPRTSFCWHCARKLRGNIFTTHQTENGLVIVHKGCKEILDGGFNYIRAIDDIDTRQTF